MEHIVLLTTSFPDRQPGSEAAGSFVADFAAELSQYVSVTVLAPGTRTSTESQESLTISRFAVPSLPLSLLKLSDPTDWINIARTFRAGQQAMDRISSEKQIDHTLALWALPSGYWARKTWKKHRVRYSIWALGSDIWTLGKIPVIKSFLSTVLRDSYKCFADGYLLKQDVESLSGRACEFLPSVRKLPVLERSRFAANPPYRLAFLGRWHPNKGIDLLLDSLHLLREEDWRNIREIRICGGGPLEKIVKSACANYQSSGRPVFNYGYLDKTKAAELLAWADYLIIPSRVESIPVVFSDAMQAQCPVIATPVGDLPRLVKDYKVGILASDVSAKALADSLRKTLQASPRSFQLGLINAQPHFNVRNTIQHFRNSVSNALAADKN
jgi:glycosyltransferase involved in cell wall biosynthesis